jgi:hypothetical protein
MDPDMNRSIPLLMVPLMLAGLATSDEGMWLFERPPVEILKERHGFEMTPAWAERVRLASVRLNSGGSGSFVSADGLVITNHHVGSDSLQKLSPASRDFYRDGFHARNHGEELKCPDLEINQPVSIEDVTARVNGAVGAAGGEKAAAARRAVIADIERESLAKTGMRSDVVTLYNGGLYHLYRYRRFTDVRLAFAPEKDIASFGGDVDNFEYPRFNLDICFFRVYVDGKPYRPEHWLRFHPAGPAEGDLVFVSGNPGATQRLETLERLMFRRDTLLPYALTRLRNREALLRQFSAGSPARAKLAQGDLYSTANARKAMSGQQQGLLDPGILATKAAQQKDLLDRAAAKDAELGNSVESALERVAAAQRKLQQLFREHALLETGDAFDSKLFSIARHLVRMSVERSKPDGQRLREYRDSAKASLELALFSPAPIHPDLERTKLAGSLTFFAEQLGGDHPQVRGILGDANPARRAAALIAGTTLMDVSVRRKLAEGGADAINASTDSLIRLASAVDPEARRLRARFESEVEEPERQAYGELARARFTLIGDRVAPDATGTPRIAFGVVRGYEVDGSTLGFHTDFAGVFRKAEELRFADPFDLPPAWKARKDRLNLATPFNFVSTADTIGGNSGSPVIDRDGRFIGINFDRNRHGLVRNFVYTDQQARHIAVHAAAIVEALSKVYEATELLSELLPESKAK